MATHAPPITHDPALIVLLQESVASTHASVVHDRPSLHVIAPPPTHMPDALHESLMVQNCRSLHDWPVRGVHCIGLVSSQIWHSLAPFIAPSA